jgi:hypothetical protein
LILPRGGLALQHHVIARVHQTQQNGYVRGWDPVFVVRHVHFRGQRLYHGVPPDVSRCGRRYLGGYVRQIIVVRHGLSCGTRCARCPCGTLRASCARCARCARWTRCTCWSRIALRPLRTRRTWRPLHRIGAAANRFIR